MRANEISSSCDHATQVLTLNLLVTLVNTDDPDLSVSLDQLAVLADLLD